MAETRIKTAKRGRTMEGQSKGSGGIFANLKSLSASMARPTRSESSTASIEPSLSAGRMYTFGSTSSGSSSTTVSTTASITSVGATQSTDKSLSKSSKYMEKLRELNLSVSSWISQNVKSNPYVDLTPIFNDYKTYWKSIESTYQDSSTTDSGILSKDSSTNSSTVAGSDSMLMSGGAGGKSEQRVNPLYGIDRSTTDENQKPGEGDKLPTVTLSLKGTGNWNVNVLNQKHHTGDTSEHSSSTSGQSSSSQSTSNSWETAESTTQQTTSMTTTDTSFVKNQCKGQLEADNQQTESSTSGSSYTVLKANTASGKTRSALPAHPTGTTGSQYSESMTAETRFDTKTTGTPNILQPLFASSRKGFLLAQQGGPAGSLPASSLGNKLSGNLPNPMSSAYSGLPTGSLPLTQASSTTGGPTPRTLAMPQTTGNSLVGSTLDQASGVLASTKTSSAAFQQQGAATPTLSTAPTDQDEDGQEEDSVEAAKTAEADDDSLYSSRAKLFYKKGEEFVELGVGTLKVEAFPNKVARVLLRNANSLKTVLLNISVTSQIPLTLTKNNLLVLCPEPHPPLDIEVKPVSYLIRVKTAADAQKLLDAINLQTGNS